MTKHINLQVTFNVGYKAEQVIDRTITLGDLLEQLKAAVEEHGEDTLIALNDADSYGASYGYLPRYTDLFVAEAKECPTCGAEVADYAGPVLCSICGHEVN